MTEPIKTETVIIGGGLIGSSVAMNLAVAGMIGIRVIDFDLEGSLSSSELNAGGVRATWNQDINIEMSQMTIDYLLSVAKEVGYKACGYLWLHKADKIEQALKARERQQALGWPVDVLDAESLKTFAPFIDKTNDIAGAIFAKRDGLVNPNLLKNHFRARAKELGVIFEDRTLLRKAAYPAKSSHKVTLTAERFENVMSHETKLDVLSGRPTQARSTVEYQTNHVINCAGPWAAGIAKILGYGCASTAVRRQVSIFDCRDVDLSTQGMIVDTSGVYFHPEATHCLAGFADPKEKPGVNYKYDGDQFFNEMIWPALSARCSKFENLKHLTGWAGLYEVSQDDCGIMGAVVTGEAGKSGGVYEAHSFSGHGLMHSYAAGLLLAELIVGGKYETFDAKPLWAGRFETGQMIRENLVI